MWHPIHLAGGEKNSALELRLGVVMTGLALLAGCADSPVSPAMPAPGTEPVAAAPTAANSGSLAVTTFANPLAGAKFFVESNSTVARQVAAWRSSRPADAALLEKIASQPMAVWFGEWNGDPYEAARSLTSRVRSAGAVPVLVIYNIPQRDCGQWSKGGAAGASEYLRWVSEIARGVGNEPAAYILEPDALAGMSCLSGADQEIRVQLLREAVKILKGSSRAAVYIDAGNAKWNTPEIMAERLARVGVAQADGFALNVSNYIGTDLNIAFGEALSRLTGGKHFVIDTSRNGAGATADLQWCNPAGRALGQRPTTATGHPLVDAFLWVKTPGESDGECNGGPSAGVFWADYALGLAMRA